MEEFLKETEFCDFSNEKIKNLAEHIAKNCNGDREFAVSAFYWVRDNILYRVGNWQRRASKTLEEKEGTCTNKSNLLVALLRYKKIPAGYGVMKVYGQTYFGPIATPMFTKFIGKISTHTYAVVFLDGRWMKCDPDVDKKFSENTSYFSYTTELIEWDGHNDAILSFNKKDILEDKFPIESIDPWMKKESKNAKGIALKIANTYINFARNNTKRVSNVEEFEALFLKYLKQKYPVYFYLFKWKNFLKAKKY
jgi:hypothetical protein